MASFLLLGDSHSQVFGSVQKAKPDWHFTPCIVTGASAQGAANPHSKSNALQLYKKALNIAGASHEYCITMLGEVDCGFVIWYRKQKYADTLANQLNRAINNYLLFLSQDVEKYYEPARILVCCAVPPTIKDNTDSRFLKGERSTVKATQHQRTVLTKSFNHALKLGCSARGYSYIDIFDQLIDSETGLVSDEFLKSNPYDHHLSTASTYLLWTNAIEKAIH